MLKDNHLSNRMNHIDSSEIRRVFAMAAKLRNPINLSIGQPHFRTPEPVIDTINKAMRDGHTSYTQTQGILELREAMAEKFQKDNGFLADPEQILISPGVAALIHLLLMSSIDPGDEVLITDPCFLIYRSMLTFLGAKIHTIPEKFSEADLESHSKKNIKFIIYCSPSNPSGYVMTKDQITSLADLAEKSGAIIVADEIYEKFDYESIFTSAASVYPESLVFNGFSKSWNMTGLRLAAAAFDKKSTKIPKIVSAMTTIQQYTFVCAPAPVQWAGITALKTDISDHISQYRQNRDLCVSKLKSHYKIDTHPGGAFYIFPKLPNGFSDTDFVKRAIEERELLVVPGRIFGQAQDRIRISYASDPQTLQRGIDALIALA